MKRWTDPLELAAQHNKKEQPMTTGIPTHPDPKLLVIKIGGEASQLASRCMTDWPPFNSAHEGFAVLKEEVDELWDHVKTNQHKRDIEAMYTEALQVAAMALRFAAEICNEERGRV